VQAYNLRALALLGSSAALLACSDNSPVATSPATHPVRTATRLPDALRTRYEALAGTAIITVSRFDGTGRQIVVGADTGRYNTALAQFGTTKATVSFGSTTRRLDVAVDARAQLRRKVIGTSRASGPNALSFRETAVAGQPLSDAEFRKGGQLVTRKRIDWERDGTYWVARRQTVTIYRNGAPVQAIEIAIAGRVTRLDQSPGAERDGSGDDGEDDPYVDDETTDEGPCNIKDLVEKMEEALLTYEGAVVVASFACATGTVPACIAAGVALELAYIKLNRAITKVEECICEKWPDDPICPTVLASAQQRRDGLATGGLLRPNTQILLRGAA
jgi:hypothetical protein